MVRMGELATVQGSGVLCTIGLGSCVGVALVDRSTSIAALAHVVLPESEGRVDPGGKFADTAVPKLLEDILGLGARRTRLEAILVGGARMFPTRTAGPHAEIGERNQQGVREALRVQRVPVVAHALGGTQGRTVRVDAEGRVRVRTAGNPESVLYDGAPARRMAA